MSLLAELIAKEEGYGIPGALPTRNNNPGDLRHSPHSFHSTDAPDGIGQIPNATEGWADLERQLELYAERGMTLAQAIFEFAPPTENNSAQYLAYVVQGLGVTSDILVSDALKIPGKGAYPDEQS
jgi:hypothetical protein